MGSLTPETGTHAGSRRVITRQADHEAKDLDVEKQAEADNWLRQEVIKGTLDVRWTPTTSILADGLTKPLSIQRQQEFVRLLGMKNLAEKGHLQEVHGPPECDS